MANDAAPVRVMVLCTHNRTRSVMVAGLLRHLLPADEFEVSSAGFSDEGLPATPDTVRLLAAAGIDVLPHRSARIRRDAIAAADWVLCAERQHVLDVVANLGGSFARTFTLPEFADGAGVAYVRPTAMAYLHAQVPEIVDPTGRPDAVWRQVWQQVHEWCDRAAERLTTAR